MPKENNSKGGFYFSTIRVIVILVILAFVGFTLFMTMNADKNNSMGILLQQKQQKESFGIHNRDGTTTAEAASEPPETPEPTVPILEGIVDGVPYNHCSGSIERGAKGEDSKIVDIVLLHARLSHKEGWRDHGVMEKLCSHHNRVQVTALDFGVDASHNDLMRVVDAMLEQRLISEKPIAIVTPSESGRVVIDFTTEVHIGEERGRYNTASNNNKNILPQYISHWIPIASGDVSRTTDEELIFTFHDTPLSILAVYGNQDRYGKLNSDRLQTVLGKNKVQVAEIRGGHACYFENPSDFVTVLTGFLDIHSDPA